MLKLQKSGSLQERSWDLPKVQDFYRTYQQIFDEKWIVQEGAVEPDDIEKIP